MDRPARKQQEKPLVPDDEGDTGGFNIWYGRRPREAREPGEEGGRRVLKRAPARCDPQRDSGYTRGSKAGISYCCIYFAKGECAEGYMCKYLHRVPTADDEARAAREVNTDIFGRPRDDSDMRRKGVGSVLRECRTLYVHYGGAGHYKTETLRNMFESDFGLWGPIERVHIKPDKTIAFVQFKWRSSAEFAKEAMNRQGLTGSTCNEVLQVRWANDDPNPTAVVQELADRHLRFAAAVEASWDDLPPDQKRARLMQLQLASTTSGTVAPYPNTNEQYDNDGSTAPTQHAFAARHISATDASLAYTDANLPYTGTQHDDHTAQHSMYDMQGGECDAAAVVHVDGNAWQIPMHHPEYDDNDDERAPGTAPVELDGALVRDVPNTAQHSMADASLHAEQSAAYPTAAVAGSLHQNSFCQAQPDYAHPHGVLNGTAHQYAGTGAAHISAQIPAYIPVHDGNHISHPAMAAPYDSVGNYSSAVEAAAENDDLDGCFWRAQYYSRRLPQHAQPPVAANTAAKKSDNGGANGGTHGDGVDSNDNELRSGLHLLADAYASDSDSGHAADADQKDGTDKDVAAAGDAK